MIELLTLSLGLLAGVLASRWSARREPSSAESLGDTDHLAVHACRRDGEVVLWSHGSEQIYGLSAAEAIGRRLPELAALPRDQHALHLQIERVLDSRGSESLRRFASRADGAPLSL